MKRIHYISIFPEIFQGFLDCSLIAKAAEKQLIEFSISNLRDFADPPHFRVDDIVYGGGAGMLMKPEPLMRATLAAKELLPDAKVLLLSAGGALFKQSVAQELAEFDQLIIVSGRYEGIDQRYIDRHVDFEISLGDFICMGGEAPAMVVTEAIVRLYNDVLGNEKSALTESFSDDSRMLETPQYTRPPEFEGDAVPETLLSGNHAAIAAWRERAARARTKVNRPELLPKVDDES